MRQLQAQVAMTPSGQYRDGLETHLDETRRHASRVERRLGELGQGSNPLQVGLGLVQSVIGQALALTKTPVDLVRGSGGEEKVLKNAKDAVRRRRWRSPPTPRWPGSRAPPATPRPSGSPTSVLGDEQRMLDRLLREIPRLTDAVASAEFDGDGSYDVSETGAADTLREVGGTAKRTARRGAGQAKRTARQARKVPGVARAEGTVKGVVASESDLAIAGYDSLSVDEIIGKLAELSQVDLAKVNAYERKHQNRSTVTGRIDSLQADEPWPGYDELGVDEVRAVLGEGDETRIKAVRSYERKHKNRAGVLQATERELANS